MRKIIEEIFIRIVRCILKYTLKIYIAYREKDYVYDVYASDVSNIEALCYASILLESEYTKPISKVKNNKG